MTRARTRHVRWPIRLAAGVYAIAVVAVVLWPSRVDARLDPWINRVVREGRGWGLPAWVDYDLIEFTANVGLFLVAAFLVSAFVPTRRWWTVLVGGAVLAVVIEVVQAVFLEQRDGSIADVVANTVGTALGVAAALIPRRLAEVCRGRRPAPPA